MSPTLELDRQRLKQIYEEAAQRYLRSLPLEHFMESPPQAQQREITLESLALVRAVWPDFQVFNELLVQYPDPDEDTDEPARVCPDNMVVLHPEPLELGGNYDLPNQPVGPILVMEYVSKSNRRKDYVDNRKKYEQDLRVPYYLLFEPEVQKLMVLQLADDQYIPVSPNAAGRLPIHELDLEVAIHEKWVRFWFRGELLPLPGDLLKQRDLAEQRASSAEQRASTAEQRASTAEQRENAEKTARLEAEAEVARLREELARSKHG